MPPNYQHSITFNNSPWKRSAQAHGGTGLGAISGATTYLPPLPPYKVGNELHFASGYFKVALELFANAYSSHSIHCVCVCVCWRGGGDGSSP